MSILEKITQADPITYIIFYVNECPYCRNALELLRSKHAKYKGYLIGDITGGMEKLLKVLNQHADLLQFDKSHRTKPIIFLDGKFIGGYSELAKHFK